MEGVRAWKTLGHGRHCVNGSRQRKTDPGDARWPRRPDEAGGGRGDGGGSVRVTTRVVGRIRLAHQNQVVRASRHKERLGHALPAN